jgi:uncharacterized spore protein YtfJ
LYYQFDEGGIEVSKEFDKIVATAVKNQEQAAKLVEKLFAVAQPGAVYGEPVTIGEHTVIAASEVKVGMGFGFGGGGAAGIEAAEGEVGGLSRGRSRSETGLSKERQGEGEGVGFGGGGGVSGGRPVAVISIGPKGVQVEPVMDPTKIALAFFTTLGSMFFMLSKMRKASRG